MPCLKVCIGDSILSSYLEWDDLKSAVSYIKPYCKWDPSTKSWYLRTNIDVNDAVESLSRVFQVDKDEISSKIQQALKLQKEKELEKVKMTLQPLLNQGIFAVRLSRRLSNEDFSKVMMLFDYKDRTLILNKNKLVRFLADSNVTSKSAVPTVLSFMDKFGIIYFEEHINLLKSIVSQVFDEVIETREISDGCMLIDSGHDVIVKFGRTLSSTEKSILFDHLTTPYFTQDSMGELVEHRLRVIKYDKENGVYRIPYFAVPHLVEVCEKLGLRVIDKIQWVEKKLPEMRFKLKLFDFQKSAVEAWAKTMRGVIVVPTGGGKTIIALAAMKIARAPTLVCVPTIELARQWVEKIREILGVNAGILGGGSKEIRDVTVAIYNSAVNSIDELSNKFDLVIFDECHHVPAETFKRVAFNIKARKRLGLSATPQRADRNEALVYFSVGKVVYTAKYQDLVKVNLASPLEFNTLYVDLTDEEWKEYAKAESSDKGAIQKTMKVALMAKKKYDVLKKLIEKHKGSKVIVFTQYVDQSEKAYQVCRKILGDKVRLITGSTSAKERKNAFTMFKSGAVTCLVTTTVLDEGIDVPDAEVAIIMSGTSTERQIIQRIGRVIRYHPNKVAKVYEIVSKHTIEDTHASRRRTVLKDFEIS